MNIVKNEYEFDFEGKKRGFKFGTHAISLISKKTGVKGVKEIFAKIAEEGKEGIVGDVSKAFYFCSAVSWHETKSLSAVDFNEAMVINWLEYLGIEVVDQMTLGLLESYMPKNSVPPMMEIQGAN